MDACSPYSPPWVRETVVAGSGDIDAHLVTHGYAGEGLDKAPGNAVGVKRVAVAWLMATAGLALLTWLFVLTWESHDLPTDMLAFLALTVARALVGGLLPALFCALASSLALNYFFTPPIHTFTIQDPQNAAALVVFLLVAGSVSSAVHLSARREAQAVAAQRESRILLLLAQSLLGSPDQLPTLLDQARDTFGMRSAAVVRRDSVRAPWVILASSGPFDADQVHDASVRTPLEDQTELILCGPVIEADDRRMVSAFATYASAILSRHELVREAQAASGLAKDNRTSTALLASVSHDLRTPLAGIKAAVSSLRQSDITWSPTDEAHLLESIEESADRLNALVGNLLDMSRLQTGTVTMHVQKLHLLDVIEASIAAFGDQGSRVRTWLPHDVPSFIADAGLLDRGCSPTCSRTR